MSDQQPSPRPQPRYGELAPEGWSWTPPEDASGEADEAPQVRGTSPLPVVAPTETGSVGSGREETDVNAPQAADREVTPEPSSTPSNLVAGVPHNLGVGSGAPPRGALQPPTSADSRPSSYRPAAPPQGGGQEPGGTGRGDRAATIALLVVATFGALYSAMSLLVMTSSFNLIASMLEVENFSVPSSVHTLGMTGALILLGLYAVMLLFSIQRLRARKLAFWIPLATGALAIIIVITIMTIAVTQMPELLDVISNPDAAARLLKSGALLGQ